jgi:hypothetical protein
VRFFVFFCLAALLPGADQSGAEQVVHRLPAMASVFPQGSTPGVKLRVEVLGEHMDRAAAAFFLDDSIKAAILRAEHTRLELEFDISRDAAWGPHYFRIVTPRGASNVLLFRIGDLPHLLEHEPNSSRAQAESVTPPVTVNGRLNLDGDFDFYRFHANSRESWIFDLRSARNGNGLDAALILMDAGGRKLAHSEERFIWDPFFEYTFEHSGDYTIAVQPTHARNDPTFAYQLDIRTAPYIETIAPLAVQPGTEIEATLFGTGLRQAGAALGFISPGFSGNLVSARGSTAVIRLRVPQDARSGPHEMFIQTGSGRSNPVTFLVDRTPSHLRGNEINTPVSITGTARYRQPELFRFQAKEGQTLVFEVKAHRFGSPVDSILRLLDSEGKQIAMNDDAQFAGVNFNKDSKLTYKFSRTGEYQIEMRNLWSVPAENYPYQLLIRAPEPGFEAMLGADQPYLYPGETGTLKLSLDRRDGFDEAVPVQLRGLCAGFTAEAVQIPAGSNNAEILIQSTDVSPGKYCRISADTGGQTAWRSVRIASGGGEGATFAKVDSAVLAAAERPDFSLEASLNIVSLVPGGSSELPVLIRRRSGFDAPLQFSAANLPPGVSLERKPVSVAGDAVTLRLKASPESRPGRFARVVILGSADNERWQAAPKIVLQIE